MKKRLLSLVAAVAMTAALVMGCGSNNAAGNGSTDTTADTAKAAADAAADSVADAGEGGKKITALFFSLEGEFFQMFDGMLKEQLESKGYTYESQSSNADPVTMIEQIENAVAGGTDAIWTWSVSGEAIADACKNARSKGVIVYSFVQDPGEEACDVFRGTDETDCGNAIAEMAMEWADKNYADAEDGAIKTVIYGNEDSTQQKERYEAVKAKIAEDPRFEVLETVSLQASTVSAQTTTENMFSKYGEINCIITPSGEMALGVLAYTHSESSPVAATDVAVFGTELNEEIASYIKDGSLIGTIMNGGVPAENVKAQAEQIDKLLKGETVDHFSPVDMGKVTLDNVAQYGY